MDAYEATKTVMSRIQALDPENSSKIMGYILIQDQGEKEMIRLAFSPDPLLLSYIGQAKARLGLSPNSPSSNPPPPFSRPAVPSSPFLQHSPRGLVVPNSGGFHLSNPPSPAAGAFPRSRAWPDDEFGYDYRFPFIDNPAAADPVMSPGGRSDSLVFPYGEDAAGGSSSPQPHPFHKRSYSVNDAAFISEGGLWRPCMNFTRGFGKNGGESKFLQGESGGGVDPVDLGSPGKSVSGFEELLRLKALQQQRFAFMASGGHRPFSYNKCMDAINENPRSDFSPFGLSSSANSCARQIYLTFPADSTFKEEDVSSYFNMFGPVQDVRIPYQQKRMFGFVTFVYPETVKLILAKGNPHFVCDSRVLVKPYKEKGKYKEKKQHLQQCLSPSGLDSGEHFDTPFGPRMLLSPREMMLRRKLEHEAEMQQAIELQGRRMMNLQLMDPKSESHNFSYLPSFSSSIPDSSPGHSQLLMNHHLRNSSGSINQENSEEFDGCKEAPIEADEKNVLEGHNFFADNSIDGGDILNRENSDESEFQESLEHVLPDNLFASPKISAAENHSSVSSQPLPVANDNVQVSSSSNDLLSSSSPLTIASLKSCYLQMPRFSSGQEGVEMTGYGTDSDRRTRSTNRPLFDPSRFRATTTNTATISLPTKDGKSPGVEKVVKTWEEQVDLTRSYLERACRGTKKWADKKRRASSRVLPSESNPCEVVASTIQDLSKLAQGTGTKVRGIVLGD
ncbi:RNA-binding (RRM/RBD/RNP motifs) family protein [Striga hermonthica]|uniref:RNA-binding (RRM/RBD/RNP motifs) family protein n=1 Tax=Striga hermonthica TaxID=68872 RepID=A0A9N7NKG6_STRHE|nr:RNA-binding (RRM/RBD/RNP motifs) family protein [Striga hermonthica]